LAEFDGPSNKGIIHDKPNITSTSTSGWRLVVALAFIGESSAIFTKTMWYSSMTLFVGDNMETHQMWIFFKILFPLVSIILNQILKFKVAFGIYVEIRIKGLEDPF